MKQLLRLLTTLGVVICCFSIIGFLGSLWWLFDIFSHFRIQYAIILSVIALFLLIRRRWKTFLVITIFALINAFQFWPYLIEKPDIKPISGFKPLRALVLNVYTRNKQYKSVHKLIQERNPDIILLIEVDKLWLQEISTLTTEYPYWKAVPRPDNFGIALFSRIKLKSLSVHYFFEGCVPSIIGKLDWASDTLTIIGTHPFPPRKPDYALARDKQLALIGEYLHFIQGSKILLGDLNTAPWSVHFYRLLQRGGLRDSALGYGLHPTWPTQVPIFWSPIDHALVSSDIAIVNRWVGRENVGSDHFPIEIDFAPAVLNR